jgi:hypothetical protein
MVVVVDPKLLRMMEVEGDECQFGGENRKGAKAQRE